jgi:hypothetical protein
MVRAGSVAGTSPIGHRARKPVSSRWRRFGGRLDTESVHFSETEMKLYSLK